MGGRRVFLISAFHSLVSRTVMSSLSDYSILGESLNSILCDRFQIDKKSVVISSSEVYLKVQKELISSEGEILLLAEDAYGVSFLSWDLLIQSCFYHVDRLWSWSLRVSDGEWPDWDDWKRSINESFTTKYKRSVRSLSSLPFFEKEDPAFLSFYGDLPFVYAHCLKKKFPHSFSSRFVESEEKLLGGLQKKGDFPLVISSEFLLEGQTYCDCQDGPIVVSEGVVLRGFNYLKGPLFLGSSSEVVQAHLSSVFTGCGVRLSGEVSCCVLGDFVNKAHEGFIGHSLVGSWVNIGALSVVSNLKNTYGFVGTYLNEHEMLQTKCVKLGAHISSFVTLGIGSLLMCGTVVGSGSHLIGGFPLSGFIPAGTWMTKDGQFEVYQYEKMIEVFSRMMERRGQKMSSEIKNYLRESLNNA